MSRHTNMERLDRFAGRLAALGFGLVSIQRKLAYVDFPDGGRPEPWQIEDAVAAVALDRVVKWQARQRSSSYV